MKSERRHSLETNDLADSAAAFVERLRPHLGSIALTAIALLLGLAAWSLVGSRREAARRESWDAALNALAAGRLDALEQVATRYPDSAAAVWARVLVADSKLGQGSQKLFSDRPQAEQLLQDAANRYSALLRNSGPRGLVAERATFGLAKAHESLGSLDDARRGYEAMLNDQPDGALSAFAAERIAALGRPKTREWYDWFAQQKPAPPAAGGTDAPIPPPTPGAAAEPAPVTDPAAPAEPPAPAEPGPTAGAGAGSAPAAQPGAGGDPGAGSDATPGAGAGTDAPR